MFANVFNQNAAYKKPLKCSPPGLSSFPWGATEIRRVTLFQLGQLAFGAEEHLGTGRTLFFHCSHRDHLCVPADPDGRGCAAAAGKLVGNSVRLGRKWLFIDKAPLKTSKTTKEKLAGFVCGMRNLRQDPIM